MDLSIALLILKKFEATHVASTLFFIFFIDLCRLKIEVNG